MDHSRADTAGLLVRRAFPLVAALLVSAAFAMTPVTEHNRGFDSDGAFYGAMAGSPLCTPADAHAAPWCYRVLTPWLARLLPWSALDSFRVLAWASNVVSLSLLFLILRRVVLSDGLCALGVLLYAGAFWTLRFSFYSPAYIDYQTQMLLLTIIHMTVCRRYVLLLPVLAIAALQRESLAAYALFAAAHLARTRGWRLDARAWALAAALVCVPAAVVYALHWAIVPSNPYNALLGYRDHVAALGQWAAWPMLAQAAFSGLGLLPALLLVQWGPWLAFLRRRAEWVVYLAISLAMLFGGLDKARLFLYCLPLVVLLSLQVVDSLRALAEPRRFAAWVVAAVAAHLYMGGWLAPMGTFSDYIVRMVPESSNGLYVPFLLGNALIAGCFIAFTVWWLLHELHVRASVGFTRRDA